MEFIKPRFTGSVGISGSLEVTGAINVLNGITGSLLGTASFALNAGDVFPYSGSAAITGTLYVTEEFSLGEISGSTPFTASQVISSSAASTRLSGSFSGSFYGAFVGVDTTLISSASATASINFDISGSSSLQINTDTVYVSGTLNVSESIRMYQSASVSGTNIFGTASHAVSASYFDGYIDQGITLSFLTASTTWSAIHGLNTLFPIVNIWDSSSNEIISPDVIESKNLNTTEIRFTVPRTGYVNIAKTGAPLYQTSPFYTASFALTASFFSGSIDVQDAISASYAATASYTLNAVPNAASLLITGSAPSGSPTGTLWYNDNDLTLYVRYQDPSGSSWWAPSFNSVVSTAVTASYATTAAMAQGVTASFLSQSTVIVNHNLGTKALIVSVYDDLDYQVIPSSVQLSDNNNAVIQFFSVESGYVVIK
jgi:hypothetical protein